MYEVDGQGFLTQVNISSGTKNLRIPSYVIYVGPETLPQGIEGLTVSKGTRIHSCAIPSSVKTVLFSEGSDRVPHNALVNNPNLSSLYIPYTAREMRHPIIGQVKNNCVISIPYGMPLIINFALEESTPQLVMRSRIRFDQDNPWSSSLNHHGQFRMWQLHRARQMIYYYIYKLPFPDLVKELIMQFCSHDIIYSLSAIRGTTIIAANHSNIQLPNFIQNFAVAHSQLAIQENRTLTQK